MPRTRKISLNVSPSFQVLLKHSNGKSSRRKIVGGIICVVLILISTIISLIVKYTIIDADQMHTPIVDRVVDKGNNDIVYFHGISTLKDINGATIDGAKSPAKGRNNELQTIHVESIRTKLIVKSGLYNQSTNIMILMGGKYETGESAKSIDIFGVDNCSGIPRLVLSHIAYFIMFDINKI